MNSERGSGGVLEYEAKLWSMANEMRGNMDAAEYKHVALGLVFLKYISDGFDEHRASLIARSETDIGIDPDDRDEYLADNVFWVPDEARWGRLQAAARRPDIGAMVDDAMSAIEGDNPALREALPKIYAARGMSSELVGRLIDLISDIRVGGADARASDVFGRVYEYFLQRFASAEGKRGGEFYTPRSVVRLLVEMLQPYRGRVYDPCCGSSGMFVQSAEFVRARAGGGDDGEDGSQALRDVSIYGQESNYTTWRLSRMNLAIRAMHGNIAHGDSFHEDRHPDLRADYILANPEFNQKAWGGERLAGDRRWRYGAPPPNNANFAWVQHIIHHLAPGGFAGFVLANASMSSQQRDEAAIRRAIVQDGLVDCMIALPTNLFYSTPIPVCLWFLSKDRAGVGGRFRDRRGETLFIDARGMGRMTDRTHRELTDDDIARATSAYHAWRAADRAAYAEYQDIPGFCKSATIEEIAKLDYALPPGRYVGAAPRAEDAEPFHEKMSRLSAEWAERREEANRLDDAIADALARLGF